MMVCTIQVIGAFLLMHSMDVVLAWVLLLITPFVVIAGKLISRTLRQMTERIRIKESRVQMLVQEGVEHNAMLRSRRGVKWMTGLL
jgi:ABC-type multidrug transport system fused ATPase/permease subunit